MTLPHKEWSRISLDSLIQKTYAYATSDSYPFLVAVTTNLPEQLTTLPIMQDLICSQNDEVMHPDLRGAPYCSTF